MHSALLIRDKPQRKEQACCLFVYASCHSMSVGPSQIAIRSMKMDRHNRISTHRPVHPCRRSKRRRIRPPDRLPGRRGLREVLQRRPGRRRLSHDHGGGRRTRIAQVRHQDNQARDAEDRGLRDGQHRKAQEGPGDQGCARPLPGRLDRPRRQRRRRRP